MRVYDCKICGTSVSKRKSLAYRGGRACRSHDQVQTAAQKEKDRQIQKRRADIGNSMTARIEGAIALRNERVAKARQADVENNQKVREVMVWSCLQAVSQGNGIGEAKSIIEEWFQDLSNKMKEPGAVALLSEMCERHISVVDSFFEQLAIDYEGTIIRYLEEV